MKNKKNKLNFEEYKEFSNQEQYFIFLFFFFLNWFIIYEKLRSHLNMIINFDMKVIFKNKLKF